LCNGIEPPLNKLLLLFATHQLALGKHQLIQRTLACAADTLNTLNDNGFQLKSLQLFERVLQRWMKQRILVETRLEALHLIHHNDDTVVNWRTMLLYSMQHGIDTCDANS
jgi:hypothetical protein